MGSEVSRGSFPRSLYATIGLSRLSLPIFPLPPRHSVYIWICGSSCSTRRADSLAEQGWYELFFIFMRLTLVYWHLSLVVLISIRYPRIARGVWNFGELQRRSTMTVSGSSIEQQSLSQIEERNVGCVSVTVTRIAVRCVDIVLARRYCQEYARRDIVILKACLSWQRPSLLLACGQAYNVISHSRPSHAMLHDASTRGTSISRFPSHIRLAKRCQGAMCCRQHFDEGHFSFATTRGWAERDQ